MAFPVSAYERNMIVQALGTDDLKAEFRKLDSEQGGNIDLQSLNKLFEQESRFLGQAPRSPQINRSRAGPSSKHARWINFVSCAFFA